MMVTAYAIVLVLVVGLALSVVKLASTLPQYAGRADDVTASVGAWLADLGVDTQPVDDALGQLDLGKVTGLLTDILTNLLGVLSSLFFLVTLLFFLSVDAAGVATRGAALAAWKPGLSEALNGFVHATRRYLVITALFGAIVAVLDAGALWLLGVPLPLVWGLLSFITNFVPNIGFIIGLIPPALLALLDQGWEQMLAVIVTYCVLNLVIQTFIQPRVVGDAVGLGTTVTFLSLVLWTFLLGSLGALLAVPMTLLVRAVLIDADPAARWSLLFVGSDETTRRLAEPGTGR
jgi:AI-2 transport protein TqsA